MTERIAFWLHDYTDEIVPCDCTLEGWATWLADPAEDWNRSDAAKDGDTFGASRGVITYHKVVGKLDDGALQFSPALPERYDCLARSYGEGAGWDADDLVEDADDIEDADVGDWIAAIADDNKEYVVTFHSDGPRCTAALAH